MQDTSKLRLMVTPLLICAALIALTFLLRDAYHHLHVTLVAVWAIMGISWNVLSGYTGLISFGHASFFGLGAYTVALGMSRYGLTPWIGIPLGGLVGAVAGAVIGFPTFRLRGPYFALAMLAYPLALLYVFAWLGLQEVTLPMKRDAASAYMQFADSRVLPVIAVLLLFAAMAVARLIEASWFGRRLFAIKQNEAAAEAAGIDTLRCKMLTIVISGAMAGVIGGFYAVVLLVVTPTSVFGLLASAQALVVAMFGGVGIVWGPVIGSAILIPVSEILHAELASVIPGIQGVIFGVAIVVGTIVAREGIYWRVVDLFRKRRHAAPAGFVAIPPADAPPIAPAAPGGDALVVSGLSKSFGGLRAVDDVSFTVKQGEVLGIIGPNGAGKTSLFNLLNGFLKPDAGSINLFGTEVAGWRTSAIARAGLGRTFQIARPFPRMSVFDNVMVGANAADVDATQAKGLAAQAIGLTGLSGVAHLTPPELTTKQLRLLELARALAGRPRILLLDETLAGLGAEEVEDAMAVIKRVATAGITIVIIEHTMHAMMRLVDRFVVLDHGAVIASGTQQETVQNPRVLEAYLGKQWNAHA
jgi:branched-chain amino acid transport system permease protein